MKCCFYKTPCIAAPMRERGEVIMRALPYVQLPTDAPTGTRFFFFGSRVMGFWRETSHQLTRLLRALHMRKSTSKSSTKKRLLYVPEESCDEYFKCLILDTLLWCDVMSTSLKEPAAKDFVARKACPIALREAQWTHWNIIKCKEHLGNHPDAVIGKATINLDSRV